MVDFIGTSLSRDVRLAAVVAAVLLSAAAAWELSRPPPGAATAEPTAPVPTGRGG
jgi:hypothetical protein